MRISFLRSLAPLALLAVSACAANFDAQVKRFQAMPAPQGQSFFIKSADPKRDGSLEFSRYAGLVSEKLVAQGYQAASAPGSANLIVSLDYGVDHGREKVRSTPGYGWAGYGPYGRWGGGPGYRGFGHHGYVYGFYDPFLFDSGYDQVESYTVYTSDLDLTIARPSGEHLFEGKAKAMSSTDNLAYLVPNLVEAMFTGFPGNSGETVKITVPPPPKKK
jgi:hypothetical protein